MMAIALMLIAAIPGLAVAGEKREGTMHLLPSFTEVDGSTVRVNATGGRAHISVRTNGLAGGNAVTLWSISFSNPQLCTHGNAAAGLQCGPGDDDVGGPSGFLMQLVAGHPIGTSGKADFGGSVSVENASRAEYHIVVADHGVKDSQQLPGQIKTPGPGVQIGFIVPAN
jgi:hypothetical protein